MFRSKAPASFIKYFYTLALICVCAVVAGAQQSQSGASGLRLLVTDIQQRALAGAVCSLRGPGDNPRVAANATTDEQGIAAFPATLAPGKYKLRVEGHGFETYNQNDVVIRDGAVTELEVSLMIASVSESVTVAAPANEATNVQAGASTAAGILQRQSLQRLPLASARIDQALPLVPGVVRSSTGEISIEGATEQQSTLLVNGLNAADPASGN